MTDTTFTHTALTEAAETAGVTPDQARTILEAAGVKVQPEKPAPGLYLHEDGRPVIMIGLNFTEPDSCLTVVDGSHWTRRNRDKLTPARVVPVTAAPVTLTEDQVGELWNANKSLRQHRWTAMVDPVRGSITATVNAALAQHAAPAEGEPIDVDDVRKGGRVRLVLHGGDEATFKVTRAVAHGLHSHSNFYDFDTIRSVRLLHREEA